jgi:hypothetical protein
MEREKAQEFAEALVLVHGALAATEVAQHVAICETVGDRRMVRMWHQVLAAVEKAPRPQYARAA